MKPRIEHLSFQNNKRIIAVSDVHGNLSYLRGLLGKLRFGDGDTLIIVGDLLEKGKYSLDTLRYVMKLSCKYDVHVVSGNCDWWYPILHSEKLVKSEGSLWYINHKPNNLARQMCREIGYPVSESMDVINMRDTLERCFPAEFDFLRAMPEIIETEHYIFVHGGLPRGESACWDAWKCMKYDRFMDDDRVFGKWVIVGHWPVMLYHESIVDANPIIDWEKRKISIDGGCVLKDDGQLNALIIPRDGSEDFSFASYDSFPTAELMQDQAASDKSYYIRWGDAEVQVLNTGAEFSRCRHLRTGYEMDILNKYIYKKDGKIIVNDCTDYVLPLVKGDTVSVIEKTSRGFFVKSKGVSGWYFGKLKMNGNT